MSAVGKFRFYGVFAMRLRSKHIPSPDTAESATNTVTDPPTPTERSASDSDNDSRDSGMATTTDRSNGTYIGEKYFPAPYLFDDADYTQDPILFGAGPWFDRELLGNELLINRYVVDGWLPGGVPVSVLQHWCWRHQFACRDTDLFINDRTPRGVARGRFARRAMDGFNRLKTFVPIGVGQSSLFLFRTHGEQQYLERLNAIPATTIEGWRGRDIVDNAAWCGSHPLLVAEFRYRDKRTAYWQDLVRHERRMRSKYGLAVPFQCLTTFDTRPCFRENAFAELTRFWRRLEVPRGCYAELPPVFSYKAEELKDPASGWWVVAYTEFVFRVVAFLLFEAYDNCKIWAVSPDLCRLAREVNLEPALGSMGNVNEALRIIGVIENTRFESLPERWRNRGGYDSGSIGRAGAGADYLFYNIHHNRALSENEAYQLSHRDRCVPDGHPRGWDYNAVPDGWIGNDDGFNPLTDMGPGNWTEDIPTDSQIVGSGRDAVHPTGDGAGQSMVVGDSGRDSAGAAAASTAAVGFGIVSRPTDLTVVREFLIEVGIPSDMVGDSSWAELRGYLRGRLNI